VIKFIIMGIWVLFVTFGGLFIGYTMKDDKFAESVEIKAEGEGKREQDNTDIMSVPVMVDGEVKGYLLVQLTFVMDENVKSTLDLPIAPFVNDAIFAEFFGAYTDRHQIEKVRFEPSRNRIIENVNQRFGTKVIKDLLVQQFNFVTAEKIREQQERFNKKNL